MMRRMILRKVYMILQNFLWEERKW
jgi:hypothetical protein